MDMITCNGIFQFWILLIHVYSLMCSDFSLIIICASYANLVCDGTKLTGTYSDVCICDFLQFVFIRLKDLFCCLMCFLLTDPQKDMGKKYA